MGFVSCLNESDNPIYCEFNGGLVPFHTQLLSYGLSEPNRKSDPITKVIKFIDVSPFIGKQAPNIFNGQLPETRFE